MKRAWMPAAVLPALLLPGTAVYYESSVGAGCTSCHEMQEQYSTWHGSTHRKTACTACHGDLWTLDLRFHLTNLRHTVLHVAGDVPEQIRLAREDVTRMDERCRNCHRQEFADWRTGPHGVAYRDIFLNREHNRKRALMDDCFRCHGMYFEGGIRDLAVRGELAGEPVMPCLACHQVHGEGAPLARGTRETFRPSLALFDRRQMQSVPVRDLPLPEMRQGARRVRMSPDQRQALCYQCHAALAGFQAGSGDDRTPTGVHEGISCLACHDQHGERVSASCATCHPRMSNCGRDVERMDTTFVSRDSRHNIHFVACGGCHPNGVPRRDGDGPPGRRHSPLEFK